MPISCPRLGDTGDGGGGDDGGGGGGDDGGGGGSGGCEFSISYTIFFIVIRVTVSYLLCDMNTVRTVNIKEHLLDITLRGDK